MGNWGYFTLLVEVMIPFIPEAGVFETKNQLNGKTKKNSFVSKTDDWPISISIIIVHVYIYILYISIFLSIVKLLLISCSTAFEVKCSLLRTFTGSSSKKRLHGPTKKRCKRVTFNWNLKYHNCKLHVSNVNVKSLADMSHEILIG